MKNEFLNNIVLELNTPKKCNKAINLLCERGFSFEASTFIIKQVIKEIKQLDSSFMPVCVINDLCNQYIEFDCLDSMKQYVDYDMSSNDFGFKNVYMTNTYIVAEI